MAGEEVTSDYQDSSVDIGIILTDLEERSRNLRDKTNLISKNFIFLKEETSKKIDEIQNENDALRKEIESLKRTLTNLTQEAEKWIRRDEIILIERMLKDFQPLEFVRKKDLNELMESIENSLEKNIGKNKKEKKIK